MKALLFIMSVLSFNAFSQTALQTLDGKVVTCNSTVDVARSAKSLAYRPLELKKDAYSVSFRIEFVNCVKKGNSFKFVRDSLRPKLIPGTTLRDTMLISYSNLTLIGVHDGATIIDQQKLQRENDGTYTVTLRTDSGDLDDVPPGKQSFEILLQAQVELRKEKNGELVEGYRETLGSYRIVL